MRNSLLPISMRVLVLQGACLCGALLATARGDQLQPLEPIDVMRLRVVNAAYPSPDGTQVAFVRSAPRLSDDPPGRDYSHLYIVDVAGGPARQLIGGEVNVSGVAWSPDGQYVCFLDKRDSDEQPQLYGLPMNGGEAVKLFHWPHGIVKYAWRPDGKAVAFTSKEALSEADKNRKELGFQPVIVDEDWRSASLHVWDAETHEVRRLSSGMHVNSFVWAPDGKRLAAAISPRALVDDSYMFQRLHLIDPAEPKVEKLVENPGKLGDYTFSPDGESLAYISAADRRDPHAGMLYTVDIASRQITSLTDGFEGMVHTIYWQQPDQITACVSRGVQTEIATLSVSDKRWSERSTGGPAFTNLSPCGASLPAKQWIVVGSTASHPNEVFRYDGRWVRLTRSNSVLEDRQLGTQTVEQITARDGLRIEGLMMRPIAYERGQTYPLVIVAHGGPESHFINGWNTSYSRWGQLLAARGYFVWMPNYRASTGRGVAFAKADHGDPMGAEFHDHLDAIAEFARRGWIDPQRVGIGGGSYGGYTAAWAATRHSRHFAAAVAFVPVVDLRTKWYCSDIPFEYYYVHYEERWPHEQREFLAQRSPLTYATQCTTPLLLLGGTADSRVHPSQPLMLYRAVKFATKTPCRLVQYPGEGHGNRVNVNRYDYTLRTLRWFDHYLKPGEHRHDPLPPKELDYSDWES
jgi:dipeptidyl aminopeptidase/acylaminoacyl peptidase